MQCPERKQELLNCSDAIDEQPESSPSLIGQSLGGVQLGTQVANVLLGFLHQQLQNLGLLHAGWRCHLGSHTGCCRGLGADKRFKMTK